MADSGAKGLVIRQEDKFVEQGKVPLDEETGSGFGWYDRLFYGFNIDNPDLVFQYTDWEARDLQPFMAKDYKARQMANVLTLPIEGAKRSFTAAKGDSGEMEWLENYWELDPLNGGCKTPLDYIISQAQTAKFYKRAFFEKVFTDNDDGQVVYDKVAFRPQTTCRELRDINHASFQGFEQEPYYLNMKENKIKPIVIPKERAYVYLHGQRIDPINGISDVEVAYWAYKTKQKIMLLWFQFLEGVSLPRMMVGASELGVAQAIGGQLAKAKNSGVVPYAVQGGNLNNVKIDTIDASGKGSDQFQAAIAWLDTAAVESILAGFLNLTGAAANGLRGGGGGSYALSKDASDFFLQMLQADGKELAYSLRKDLFAPLIRYNFGKNAAVPHFGFEPLNDEDKSNSIAILQAMITASAQQGASGGESSPIPAEFIAELADQVADYIGLDGNKVGAAFRKASTDAQAQAKAMAAQNPALGSPQASQIAGVAGAVGAAGAAVKQAQTPTAASPASAVTSSHGKALLAAWGAK